MTTPLSSPFAVALSTSKLSEIRTLLDPQTPQGWSNLLKLNADALRGLQTRISVAPGLEVVRRLARFNARPLGLVLAAAAFIVFVLPNPALLLFFVGAGLLASAWWQSTGKALRDLEAWLVPLSKSPAHWTAAAACVSANESCAAYHRGVLALRELLVVDALALDALLIAPHPEQTSAVDESPEAATARAVLWPTQSPRTGAPAGERS